MFLLIFEYFYNEEIHNESLKLYNYIMKFQLSINLNLNTKQYLTIMAHIHKIKLIVFNLKD